MRPLWTMGLFFALGLLSRHGFAASSVTIDVAVYWEGRELQNPNVDALERMRKAFPDIPLTHFINPAYFLDEAKSAENMAAIQQVLKAQDEVGLYLAPMEALVNAAGVILKLTPSFWGYMDESDFCDRDCGLDVPLTVYSREEVLRLFAAAHRTLYYAGFSDLKSYTVRGWLEAPFLNHLAAGFGYRYDHTPIDPRLVTSKLREFPISEWVQARWGTVIQSNPETLQKLTDTHPKVRLVPSRGGILELNEQREILARFDRFVKERGKDEVFTLGLSAANAFQSWPRLREVLHDLNAKAKTQGLTLRYATVSGVKNSRPTASNMRISSQFSQQAEGQK